MITVQHHGKSMLQIGRGVVRDDGRILVIKRQDNGQWQPPGGVLELAETLEEGVEREVLEETGVRVAVRRLTGVYKNMPLGVVALAYLCTPVSGTPTTSAEAAAVQWMTLDQVREAMSPAFAIRVLDAFDEPAQSRSHDGVTLIPPSAVSDQQAVEAETSGTEANP